MNKVVTLLNFHKVNIKRYCRCRDHHCVPLNGMLKIFVIPYKKELIMPCATNSGGTWYQRWLSGGSDGPIK